MATHDESHSHGAFSADSLSPSDQFVDLASIKDEATLKQILLKQLEYYFSRKNLATDSFLVSQMNAELFVPVSVVAQFAKIQALTTDEDLLLDAMKSSPQLIVDEAQRRVRPNFQIQRNTLILRDIPSDADSSAVEQLFKGEALPHLRSIKPEIGNTWFVTFDTEAEAIDMLNHIRGKKFNGQPIGCRLKSENLLKSFRENEAVLEANPPLKSSIDRLSVPVALSAAPSARSAAELVPFSNPILAPQAAYYYPGVPVSAPYMMDYYAMAAGYPVYPPMGEHSRYPMPLGAYHGTWKYRGGPGPNPSYNVGYHGDDGGGNRQGGQYYHQRPYHQRSSSSYRQKQWKSAEERNRDDGTGEGIDTGSVAKRSSSSGTGGGDSGERREQLEQASGTETVPEKSLAFGVASLSVSDAPVGAPRQSASRSGKDSLEGAKSHHARDTAFFEQLQQQQQHHYHHHQTRSATRDSDYKKSSGNASSFSQASAANRRRPQQSSSSTAPFAATRASGIRVASRRNSQPQFAPDSFPSLTNSTSLSSSDTLLQHSPSKADGQKAYSAVAAENARTLSSGVRPSASPSRALPSVKKPLASAASKTKPSSDKPNIRMDELSLAQDLIAPNKAADELSNHTKDTLVLTTVSAATPTATSSPLSYPVSSSHTNASASPSSPSASPSSTPTKTAASSYAEILRKSKSNAVPLSAASTSA